MTGTITPFESAGDPASSHLDLNANWVTGTPDLDAALRSMPRSERDWLWSSVGYLAEALEQAKATMGAGVGSAASPPSAGPSHPPRSRAPRRRIWNYLNVVVIVTLIVTRFHTRMDNER